MRSICSAKIAILSVTASSMRRATGTAASSRCAKLGAGAARCTVYRADIGGLLPVYVHDDYEGIEARTFSACSDEEIADYLAANVAAVEEVVARASPEVALANHLVMGPVILARALRGELPYAVKVHGSALEYTVKPELERFIGFASEGLADARGSWLDRPTLLRACGRHWAIKERFRLVHALGRQASMSMSSSRVRETKLQRAWMRLPSDLSSSHLARATNSMRSPVTVDAPVKCWPRSIPSGSEIIVYVGKLIVSKGVDLLLACWPLVLSQAPDAHLVVVGFGGLSEALERLIGQLAAGDLSGLRDLATRGRALEGGEEGPLKHLLAFLEELEGDGPSERREAYLLAASSLAQRVSFVGRLEHRELVDLLPACEAIIVPSTFPEAFGMVAVEGAACGALPISAAHSGLLEVSATLAALIPTDAAPWLTFENDDRAVASLSSGS